MRLSLQLYTVRDQLAVDESGTLKRIADVGYRYVEAGYHKGDEAARWRGMLDAAGLKCSGFHAGIDVLRADMNSVELCAEALGTHYVIVPWLAESERSDWEALGRELSGIGKSLAAEGLTLAYHNHDFEFRDDGLEKLFSSASSEHLKSELDVAWVQIGGADPVAWIHRLAERLPLVHLKDFNPARSPIWTPAGQGMVDWDSVLEACRAAGVEFGAVELDESPGSPLDAIRASFDFFTARGVH